MYASKDQKPGRYHVETGIELENYHGRHHERRFGEPFKPLSCIKLGALIPFVIINAGLITWLVLYSRRVTQPFKYPEWVFGTIGGENIGGTHTKALIAGLILLSLLNALMAALLLRRIYFVKYQQYSPEDHPEDRPTASSPCFIVIAIICVLGILVWPLASFTSVPDKAWYKMMKDTCIGFDMRVSNLDNIYSYGKGSWATSSHKLNLQTPGQDSFYPPLYIGNHSIINAQDPLQHYQNFFRISGTTPQTERIAVDFDFDHRIWRMFEFKEENFKEVWFAENFDKKKAARKSIVHQQTSLLPTDALRKTGTWSKSTNRSNHSIIIPELALQIPHWYGFTQSYAFEPFLKLHSTANMTTEEIETQANATWTKFNDETVLMRTASFGHGQSNTAVCIREADWEENGVVHKGLGDDMLVPLGLLATYRMKFEHENLRSLYGPQAGESWDAHQDILT